MRIFELRNLKKWSGSFLLMAFLIIQSVTPTKAIGLPASPDNEQALVLLEQRYDKLMRIYLNKIKLAFSEPDDSRSRAILDQFLPEFTQKTDALKAELKQLSKGMSASETEELFDRLSERSHTEELVSLLFDERITKRLASNPDLESVMNRLQAKSLEIEKTEREVIAIGE